MKRRPVVVVVSGAFVALAVAAAVRGGTMLDFLDVPVTQALLVLRRPGLDAFVKGVSGLGGLVVVSVVLAVLLVMVWHACRGLAMALLLASAARPLLEWSLKEAVDRPRPALGRLVAGNGPSFPSGHVMAAVAVWGLLPPVVALVTGRRRAWWSSVMVSSAVIAGVGFSRVYLGVHWLTDVVGALLLGALYLLAIELLLAWHHRTFPCRQLDQAMEDPP